MICVAMPGAILSGFSLWRKDGHIEIMADHESWLPSKELPDEVGFLRPGHP
jgi:hypothetical protein